jgi:hypothetical protein
MASVAEQLITHISGRLSAIAAPEPLALFTEQMVEQLLQRGEDKVLRDKTIERVRTYFQTLPQGSIALLEAKDFAIEVISIIVQIRHQRGAAPMTPLEIDSLHANIEDEDDGPARGQATEPTRIVMVPPPEPEIHPDFQPALAAALRYKVGQTLTFFQRWNPRVFRKMPQPFLLAIPFGAALDKAIAEMVVPAMLESRTVRHVGTLYRWDETDSVKFWEVMAKDGHLEGLKKSWHAAWEDIRPQQAKKKTPEGEKTVLRAGPLLVKFREMLTSDKYAMPAIGTREIDLFASWIEPDCTRQDLENAWTKLRQIYEQELDRRFYQDKARTGALRDSLLECFEPFTPRTAELLALLCYRNFPYLTLNFLIAFTQNHGFDDASRKKRIPYLSWFLELPEAESAAEADEVWIAAAAERDETRQKTAAEQAEKERAALMGGVVWSSR